MTIDLDAIFRKHGGQLRMSEAVASGVSRYQLYKMRDKGEIVQVSRGVYRLASLDEFSLPDLAVVSLRFPDAVVCLVSALNFHEITTQIPRAVSLAVARNARLPKLAYPPITPHRFSGTSFSEGIEEHLVDGIVIKVYGIEKTIADCVKFRNKLGSDIILEALKMYRGKPEFNVDRLMHFARICRVDKIIVPYIEAML